MSGSVVVLWWVCGGGGGEEGGRGRAEVRCGVCVVGEVVCGVGGVDVSHDLVK